MKKYALITGASSGIGYEISKTLIKKGFCLIVCSRRTDRLQALKKYAQRYGVDVTVYPCDLSVYSNAIKLHERFKDENITLVVNSAGGGLWGDFDKIDLQKEIDLINLNVISSTVLTKLFSRTMKKGTILNVCSAAAFCPDPKMSSYGASKAYMYSYCRAVNYELKRQNKPVRVALLCPGAVDTEFDKNASVKKSLPQISAFRCATEAVYGFFSGKDIILPTLKIKASYILSKLLPTSFTTSFQYKIQNKKQ